MRCPKCNTELAPGNVYCPVCGQEVQIVPDYDPLDEVLWDHPDTGNKEKKEQQEKKKRHHRKMTAVEQISGFWNNLFLRRMVLLGFGIVICAGIAFGSYYLISRQNSYSYQLRHGMTCYENGELEGAIRFLKRAQELQKTAEKEDLRPVLFLARTYQKLGEADMAAELLESLLGLSLEEKEKLELYEELFQILQEAGRTDEINGIIETCSEEEVRKRLLPYRIAKPRVSIQGGEYHYYVYPQLEADYGTIYYTLDGSIPTAESTRYSGRVNLQEGDNLLTAVAINEKGIVSEQLFVVYTLDFDVPMDMTNKNDTIRYDLMQ